MKLYAPNYYKAFSCIADRCKHSCCTGWEIDVDADALDFYQTVQGAFGKRLRESIAADGDTPHFILGENERCPFLNEKGLCDLITELGEVALCQICTDHPRYRNYYTDRTEIGLGLCCEAAAKLILTCEEKVQLVLLEDDGAAEETDETEEAFFVFRARLLAALQDRDKSMSVRRQAVQSMLGLSDSEMDIMQWVQFYLGLEVLDASWKKRLLTYTENAYAAPDLMQEQMICYFLYRHLTDGIDDGSLTSRVAFALHASWFICALAENEADLLDIARMYSAEIEYSEENLEKVLEKFA